MHILFVVSKFPDLSFILRTVQAIAQRGHRVTVAARNRGNWTPFQSELPLAESIEVKYLPPSQGLSDVRRALALILELPLAVVTAPRAARTHPATRSAPIRQFIQYLPFVRLRPDVIQFDFPMTASNYKLLPELLGAPTVVSCRGSDIHMLEQRDADERNRRLHSLRDATAIHCVSSELAAEVTRLTGRKHNIWVNRPAVPTSSIRPKAQYASPSAPLIITVGRLTWIKGYDYFLAALARLKQEGVAFQAQIIGGGELYSVLRFSIGDLNLSDRVQLIGELPAAEVLRRLPQADLFVISSHQEGVSNAALEGMAAGLPVVTTTAGGMSEVVRNGVDGFVVPVRDIRALADRIKCLLADAELRERMGRAARQRIEADFGVDRQARVFEQIYEAAVAHS